MIIKFHALNLLIKKKLKHSTKKVYSFALSFVSYLKKLIFQIKKKDVAFILILIRKLCIFFSIN
jgi:hypothetical protein